jgi:hypothetical protein
MSEMAPTEPQRANRNGSRPGFRAISAPVWVVLGVVAGVGATLVIVRQIEPRPSANVGVGAPIVSPAPSPGVSTPGKSGPVSPPPPQPIEPDPTGEAAQAAGAGPAGALTGSLPAGQIPPVNPVVINGGEDVDGKKESRFVELSVSAPQTDMESVENSVAKAAQAAGGEAHRFSIPKTQGDRERSGLLLFVPDDQLDAVQSQILGMGTASVRFEWKGPLGDRRFRIERPLRDALSDLEREERTLVEKYLDDAPLVVDVRERIDAVRKSLDNLTTPGRGIAVIRVYVGHRV